MFADKYLKKNNNIPLINKLPEKNLGLIVVIPCLREPDIAATLKSLLNCDLPACNVEVIVLINHSEIADEPVKQENWETYNELQNWITNNEKEGIRFYATEPVELKKKWAGAGLARKKGMDEAIRRFNILNREDGLVVSLDADTLVGTNYLFEIDTHFQSHRKHIGATIAFEHQKADLSSKQLKGIDLYEQYLHYYKNALEYTGYPYSLVTIGSAFAVTAGAYVKRGGMNRRQAGEDFYFLQNLVQMGTVGEITSTKVYPSARLSSRVPFGTGPVLQKWMNGEEDLNYTYDFKAFTDLKRFFECREKFFKINKTDFNTMLSVLPESISAFIKEDNFWKELNDLNKNCSSSDSFVNRFFQKFNAFKILKYLNFAHERFYRKEDMQEQIALLNQKQQA